jgi:hypothetical protein
MRRVFKQFARLGVGSDKLALSRPAHQRVTPAVRQPSRAGEKLLENDELYKPIWLRRQTWDYH